MWHVRVGAGGAASRVVACKDGTSVPRGRAKVLVTAGAPGVSEKRRTCAGRVAGTVGTWSGRGPVRGGRL
ncbi:hypothetical protein GCM10018783_26160 [Streptomyces griseosporeus]|nr:hypothetical protein GCM10018783_26160 [Streptomyces griseosporeus]